VVIAGGKVRGSRKQNADQESFKNPNARPKIITGWIVLRQALGCPPPSCAAPGQAPIQHNTMLRSTESSAACLSLAVANLRKRAAFTSRPPKLYGGQQKAQIKPEKHARAVDGGSIPQRHMSPYRLLSDYEKLFVAGNPIHDNCTKAYLFRKASGKK
jgi:hypothetical protein